MTTLEVFSNYLSHVKDTCAKSTVATYSYKLNMANRLLGNKECDSIKVLEAQAFIDDMCKQYKSKTVKGIYDVVNAAFSTACIDGLIDKNPFQGVKVSKVERHNAIVLDSEGVSTVVDTAKNNPNLYLPILIATETGLRRSQVLALEWQDIDFAGLKIFVNKNVINSKHHLFTEGKEHQNRSVVMSSYLSEVLLGVKNYRRSIGVSVEPDDYVCLTSNYKVMEPTYFSRLFKKFVKENDSIPENLRFHDLRWSYIRSEVEKGTDPMIIADKVGHKSCVFTMDYYYRYHNRAA